MSVPISREKTLFYEAVEVADPVQRKLFLDQACAGDAELRAAVEELLATQGDAEQFFAESASSLTTIAGELESAVAQAEQRNEPTFEEKPGTIIGRYKLLQKIGEGGYGVVYMAEQEQPVRRRVALKVIKLGMDTKNVIARFEAERQALAMMDHPNIARVFDAGATETGRPYFVMELVNGVRITEYCDQNQLGLEQRLELFIQICHAIQHAHQKGIIHRDIKPSNILVTLHDGVPVPKVIDFGIAKATEERLTDKTLFTAHAQLIGTPAYMSPEQVELSGLGVDTRSDIYSLGVLLYELLTGKTPFDTKELLKSGVDEMRRTLREREPTTPSAKLRTLAGDELTKTAMQRHVEPPQLLSQLRGDLDWIIMKALEKDRTRRYETANGLAMDVQRYLDNETVLARPPSNWYRLQKLVRRHRIVFLAGCAVGAALLIGAITSTSLFIKERAALRRADAAQQESETARATEAQLRREAESREKITRASLLVQQQKFEEADKLLNGIELKNPSKDAAAALRALGDWYAKNGQWRQAAERFATLVTVDQLDDPDTTTLDYWRLGPVLIEAGDSDGYQQSREQIIARFSGMDYSLAVRILKINLLLPADQEIIKPFLPQVEMAEKTFGDEEREKSKYPEMAWRAQALGLLEYRRGNYAKATNYCDICITCPVINAPRNAAAHVIKAMCLWKMNQYLNASSELTQGQEMIETKFKSGLDQGTATDGFWFDWVFARVLLRECQQQIAAAGLSLAQISELQTNLDTAVKLRTQGDSDAVNGRWQQAAERFATLVKVDQHNNWDNMTLDCLRLGTTLIEAGKLDSYEQFREDTVSRFGSITNPMPDRIIKCCLLLSADGKLLQALQPQIEAAEKKIGSGRAPWTSMSLALFEHRRGNYAEAASICRACLAYPDHNAARDAAAHVILAMSCWRMNQPQAAQSEFSQGREMIETKFQSELDQGNAAQGFWFDWVFDRILLREAAGLLPNMPNQTNSPAQ